jgi:hypothetical protein
MRRAAWSPGIGDPSVVGWLTVALYFLAAWQCWKALRTPRLTVIEKSFWRVLALLLVVLGINKQLDLQTAFTELGRWIAHRQGWYEQRHEVQVVFVAGALLAGLVGAVGLLWLMRRSAAPIRIAIVGCCALVAYVVVRAVSIHHVDRFIHSDVFGIRMNWLLEIGGICSVVLGAVRQSRGAPRRVRPR